MSDTSIIVDTTARRRHWSVPFLAGLITGVATTLLVAVLFGPRQMKDSEDPLTGHMLRESTWLGMQLSHHVEGSPHATWAIANSVVIPDHIRPEPGRFGWTVVSAEGKQWFGHSQIGCGGGYQIPYYIFQGQIVISGKSKAEVLKLYQAEAIAEYEQHGTMQAVQKHWTSRVVPAGA